MNKKRKVLMFLQSGVGGAERMTITIGKSLDREKFEVVFYLIDKGGTASSVSDFIPHGYRYETITSKGAFNLMTSICKTIRAEKPAIVFSSVLYINNKVLPLRWLFPKTRFIIRIENYLYTFHKNQLRMINFCYRMADHIIAQTQEMKDELVSQMNINESKIHVLGNPVDTATIDAKIANATSPYPKDGKKHLVASGRFAYQKGFDLLIEAFALLSEKHDDVDLYIIGSKDGSNEKVFNDVWTIVESKRLQNRVYCEGFQTNPYKYVKYADAFVLSSRWEGLPNVLIESLYLGTPAAAFKCIPVIERIIDDGRDGYLAEKENPESLALAMSKVLDKGRISSNYKGATPEDFSMLFDIAVK